jgi:hypothetical protein
MRKLILSFFSIALLLALSLKPVQATQLYFDPIDQLYGPGDTLTLDLYANIDEADAIFGFDFDLSFDDGTTYVSGPGDSGDYLTFTGFSFNSALFVSSFWDDGDTISGEVSWGNPDVWGNNTLLGTFAFTAPSSSSIGTENIYLGPSAGDYGIFGDEGLIGATALMPNNPTASVAPVPEPGTILLVATGLAGFASFRKKLINRRTRFKAEPKSFNI